MSNLIEFNPLKSIAIPNVGQIQPSGLVLVIGPNSAGKTQFLRDIQSRLLGEARTLVVCEEIKIERPDSFDAFVETLIAANHVRRVLDTDNNPYINVQIPMFGDKSDNWSIHEPNAKRFFNSPVKGAGQKDGDSDKFLEHFGRSFVSSLFLNRRLSITDTVPSFDYETASPVNEIQALYDDSDAKRLLTEEAMKVFGKAVWVDNTRSGKLCLRVSDSPEMPSADDRLEPSKMKQYRLMEDEGDGFKSYMAICLSLLLGRRPVMLVDEPEMCLHPPQAYSLGRFIGRHAISPKHVTFVATHSSHVLRGIIEETNKLEVIRLSRINGQFYGRRVESEALRETIDKPSTRSESVLDGLFAEAVTVVESEGDRLVYNSTWEKVSAEFSHDVHFVSVGGLGGIADPCSLYKTLKIPVCVAADLDVIRETGTFKKILEAVAPSEEVDIICKECESILDSVKALGPIHNEEVTREILESILGDTFDWNDSKQLKEIRGKLSKLAGGLSQTARLKQGLSGFQQDSIFHDLKALLSKCRTYGVFLVPVGELEDWVSDLMTNGPSRRKKADWANYAALRIRETDVRDNDVWDFIRQMANFQRNEGARLAGYPSRNSDNGGNAVKI